jgi:hypothetical protein
MRELYREALAESREQGTPEPPSPYRAESAAAFLAWIREPQQGAASGPDVSRYLLRVWAERPELVAAFPDVPGIDSPRYLAWVSAEAAVPGVDVPAELLG